MRLVRHRTLLGVALEGKGMTACVLRHTGSQLEILKTVQAPLSLDLLSSDPVLAGQEIRNHLDGARIRVSSCVVSVPLKWALTLRAELPPASAGLSEADVDSFVAVQAERGFPFPPEELSLAVSRYRTPGGAERVTIVALPAHHVEALRKVFRAARLRPASITLGVSALSASRPDTVSLLLGENGADLQVSAGGGVVALRSLEDAIETDLDGVSFDADMIAGQLRITLGQLPQALRDTLRTVRVFGPDAVAERAIEELADPIACLGMQVEAGDLGLEIPGRVSPSACVAAARHLSGQPAGLEFLPPRTSRFRQVAGRVSSRAAAWLVAAAAVLVMGAASAFLWQHVRLSRIEAEWRSIEARVGEVEALQEQVRKFRPWFDDSLGNLCIARTLTEAFPQDGAVWAKSVAIKDSSKVTCTGHARSNGDLLAMLDALRETPGVEDVQVAQVRGESPLQFSLGFHWNGGGRDGN